MQVVPQQLQLLEEAPHSVGPKSGSSLAATSSIPQLLLCRFVLGLRARMTSTLQHSKLHQFASICPSIALRIRSFSCVLEAALLESGMVLSKPRDTQKPINDFGTSGHTLRRNTSGPSLFPAALAPVVPVVQLTARLVFHALLMPTVHTNSWQAPPVRVCHARTAQCAHFLPSPLPPTSPGLPSSPCHGEKDLSSLSSALGRKQAFHGAYVLRLGRCSTMNC